MRIFALELDNDIKGIGERDAYVEGIIRSLVGVHGIFKEKSHTIFKV